MEIVLILLNKSTVTAKELADRFNVSTRTIYRDVDELSSTGVPVYPNKGSGGGISLLENYVLHKALLTEHRRDSLLLALRTLQSTKYPEIEVILDKIGALFKNTAADKAHKHDYDQLICLIGEDWNNVTDFDAEIELFLGEEAEKHVIDNTSVVCIPKGLMHYPLDIKRVGKPFLFIDMVLSSQPSIRSQPDAG